jgi:hypothetical protein
MFLKALVLGPWALKAKTSASKEKDEKDSKQD